MQFEHGNDSEAPACQIKTSGPTPSHPSGHLVWKRNLAEKSGGQLRPRRTSCCGLKILVGHRTLAGGGDELGILGQHSTGVTWLWLFPRGLACGKLFI